MFLTSIGCVPNVLSVCNLPVVRQLVWLCAVAFGGPVASRGFLLQSGSIMPHLDPCHASCHTVYVMTSLILQDSTNVDFSECSYAASILQVEVPSFLEGCSQAILSREIYVGVCRRLHPANLYSAISVLIVLNG